MKLFNVEIVTDPETLQPIYMFSGKINIEYLQEQSAICTEEHLFEKIGEDFLRALKEARTLEG